MEIHDVMPVTEARRTLPSLIEAGATTVIGAYGKAQAVLVPAERYRRTPPPNVVEAMLRELPLAVSHATARPHTRGTPLIPGADYGRVVVWLWQSTQRDRLWRLIADTMDVLRRDAQGRGLPRPPLSDFLNGLATVLDGLEQDEEDYLLRAAVVNVPHLAGADLNAP